ncbi:MAG: outer membrane beta-barrel protein [Desulfobulbus sp.]|nr:outer membrane beta-barrel protein [Desulfobulbus sp.]
MKMKLLISALAFASLTLNIAGAAQADQATDTKFVVKLGVADVMPKSNNGTLVGLDADVGSSARPSLTLEYMITPNIGVELLAAWPFCNDVSLAGLGKVGSVDVLPPTLSLQYHFLPEKTVSPFVGVGINYTFMFSEDAKGAIAGSNLDVDNSWGFAAHVGVDFNFDKNWLMTVDARWIQMRNDVYLNGNKIGKVDVNPIVLGIAVGYRF